MSSNYTTGPDPALSRNPVHRATQSQTTGINARLKALAPQVQGVPAAEADDLAEDLHRAAGPRG
ncbi:hypothetical protein SUDANB171_05499 [Streptomyces sp. enrichment culture]|uniref:hypothetical protein n=1 Tax=Streptomyces sp. enrichment culture TaxID=1795815 RepID=UPI003F567598